MMAVSKIVFMDCENYRPKIRRLVESMYVSARRLGYDVDRVSAYKPFDGLLVCYGCGRPDLTIVMEKHIASGNPVLTLDAPYWRLGYWQSAYRLAVNSPHPKMLFDMPANRFDSLNFKLTDEYDPAGPILLIGVGPKSRHVAGSYECDTLLKIRQVYPGRRIIYRPKPNREFVRLHGVKVDAVTPISELLAGASLVVTRHSNVGIDAAFKGIPVVTETGAAIHLYSDDLANPHNPDVEERRTFLRRLAWWNWAEGEMTTRTFWDWWIYVAEATI